MTTSLQPHRVFDAVAVSSTNSYYSGTGRIGAIAVPGNDVGTAPAGDHVTFTGKFTSTPNGTLTIEVSDATDEDVRKGTDFWNTYTQVNGDGWTNGVATVTSGQINGSATFAVELVEFAYKRVRFKYVNASGSGTITIIVNIKLR